MNLFHKKWVMALAIAACPFLCGAMARASPPRETIPLYTATAPGSEQATQTEVREFAFGEWRIRNVTQPTLTVYLPDRQHATGAGVIVAPGGGFLMLSIESEGEEVAKWLNRRGIAAFLLKYRLNESAADPAEFQNELEELFTPRPEGETAASTAATVGAKLAMADGLEAVKQVRRRAAAWKVSPHRIGFLGFSAGGIVALNAATAYEPGSRPDFVGSIYGALLNGLAPPQDAPPLFLAVAADDPLLAGASAPVFAAWQAAKRPAELHVYQKGGHGFGINHTGNDSDHWTDEFYWWLLAQGLLARGP
jgi:acetyl esterase/lipase